MLDRIVEGGILVFGALILFIAFVAILFIMEKKVKKKEPARKPQKKLYVVRKSNKAA